MNTVTRNRMTMTVAPIVLGLALALGAVHPSYATTPPVVTVAAHLTCMNTTGVEQFDITISTTSTVKGVVSSLSSEVVGETSVVGHGNWYVQTTPVDFMSLQYPISRTVRSLEIFDNKVQVATLTLNGSSCQQPASALQPTRSITAQTVTACQVPWLICSPTPWWVRR